MAPDPLVLAWNAVVASLGAPELRATDPEPEAVGDQTERLAALAARTRVRARRVVLARDWWRRDCGPLVGFLADGDRPVALLPRAWGGYVLVDPARGTRATLTDEAALALAPFGFALYRSFPLRPLGLLEVLRFGARSRLVDLALVFLAALVVSALVAALALAGGMLVNTVVPSGERALFLTMASALLVTTLTLGFTQAVRAVALIRLAGRMRANLQAGIWDRLLDLPTPFFRRYPTGELVGRAMSVDSLQELVSGPSFGAAVGLVTSLFSWVLLFRYDALLGLATTALLGALIAAAALVQARTQLDRARLLDVHGRLASLAFQLLNGIAKLKVAAAEPRAFQAWLALYEPQHRLAARIEWRDLWLQALSAASPALGLLVVLALLAAHPGRLSAGDFVTFSAALTVVLNAVLQAVFAAPAFLQAVSAYRRAAPILSEAPEVQLARRLPRRLAGQIEVRDVSFRYDPKGPLILDRVSLTAEPGEFVAIVGPSGAGKSTLLRLLLGFERPGEGAILFDGQDLADLDVGAVRRQFGAVLQNGRLIPGGTIFDNIAGSRSYTLDQAWEAARAAGLGEDIEQMPMGLHTFVAEGASAFSGGQRQRLLIARAIISRPGILLFDEATSDLDNRTQARVKASIERLQATRIIIAHRLSTIAGADRIYVLDRGRVVQRGTFAELRAVPGPFRELARRQLA